MGFIGRISIARRLLLLAVAPIVVVAVVLVSLYQIDLMPRAHARMEAELSAVHELERAIVERWIADQQRALRYLAQMPAVNGWDAQQLLTEARRFASVVPAFRAIVITDAAGGVIVDSLRDGGGGSVADRDYFRRALAGSSVVSGLVQVRTSGLPLVIFAEPVREADSRISGVVFAPVTPETLTAVMPDSGAGGIHSYLVDQADTVILGTHVGATIAPPTTGEYLGVYEVPVIGRRSPIDQAGWTLVTEVPVAPVLDTLRRYNRAALAALAVTALFALFIAVSLSQTIGGPLAGLAAAARAAGRGEYASLQAISTNPDAPPDLVALERTLREMALLVERREREITARRERMEAAEALAHLGSWTYDRGRRVVALSDEAARILGTVGASGDLAIGRALAAIHPEDRPRFRSELRAALRSRRDRFECTHRIIAEDTRAERYVLQRTRHEWDAAGRLVRIQGMIHDLSLQHQFEESLRAASAEKSVLLREVHHRVRNNLSVIQSILGLQQDEFPADSPTYQALGESFARVVSIALVHEQMYETQDFNRVALDEYLSDLALSVRSTFGGDSVEFDLDLEPVAVSLTRSVPVGMILNELLVTACKRVQRVGGGSVAVRLAVEADTTVLVEVGAFAGCGDLDPSQADGNASRIGDAIIEQLAQQVDGTVVREQADLDCIVLRVPVG